MSDFPIAVLVGSLRRESINRRLATALASLGPADFRFQMVKIDDLPLYNQDHDNEPAPSVVRLRAEVAAARGVLFVTPEYNRSIPGVLKNAIDHGSRPYGKSVWSHKPTGVISASAGAIGGALAQQHLRNVLAFLDAPTMGQPEAFIPVREGFFNAEGGIASDDTRQFLQTWIGRYAAWVRAHAA